MEIYYKSKKLKRICNSEKASNKEWGIEVAQKVRQRLFELYAANNLSHISHLPPLRLHQLKGKRKNQFAVDINSTHRLIFEPANNPLPLDNNGGIDKTQVTEIIILEVVNYHGKKNI